MPLFPVMVPTEETPPDSSIADSLREYGRGFAGGLLFSLPLLYTMEVWWSGFIAGPLRLLALLAATLLLLLGYNRYAGMRRDTSWTEIVVDSVEEFGLGLITAAAVLYLIGRIGPGVAFEETLGKVVVETAVVAIGFSVGTAQLGTGSRKDSGKSGAGRSDDRHGGILSQIVIAACGAVLFGANVAPTEEIVVAGVETGPWRLLGIAVVSMALAMLILFFIHFRGSGDVTHAGGKLDVILGTVITYAVALGASATMLWFFGRFEGVSLGIAVRQLVVLAFPASIGASAGRLLLQV